MAHKSALSPNAFTETSPCPYFRDGREATVEYIVADAFSRREFDTFLSRGYRRLGRVFYRNVCSRCSACKPIRIEVEKFIPGRSGKRTLKKNEDLQVRVTALPGVTPEKLALYEHYVRSKHGEPVDTPAAAVPAVYALHYGYDHIIEMNYFVDGTLMGVGIIDEGEDALSSNYFYYDTAYLDRRPGAFSILQEISLAKKMGKRYYYLGFYIADNPAMSYKKDFRPNQILEDDVWIEFLS
jgi:arginyl-tRNA--protein-N-Asp/Glu arginylyltransferase